VVRFAHQTVSARAVARLLLLLAVSPVTAPFTTCDLFDFMHPLSADAGHHPGRQMAEATLKAPRSSIVVREVAPAFAEPDSARRIGAMHTRPASPERGDLHAILRL